MIKNFSKIFVFLIIFLFVGAGCSSVENNSAELPVSENLVGCPSITTIENLISSDVSFVEGGPFDATTFVYAKAKKQSGRLYIYISNKDFSISKLTGLNSPVKGEENGVGVFGLVFSNASSAVDVAIYDPTSGYGNSYWVTAEMYLPVGPNATNALLGMNAGQAEILAMNDSQVCGTFDLSSAKTKAKGTFVASFK
ncbi:MAG: hypothetical protein WC070_01895 [Candidatus Magasanikbacteria bacterium]